MKIAVFLLASSLLATFLTICIINASSQRTDEVDSNINDLSLTKILTVLQKPRLVIKKKERTLELFDGEKLVKTYEIALGFEPNGDKAKQGDGRTPEGEFYIDRKNSKSKFYLSLGLSYPSIEDAERGLRQGLITENERDAIVMTIRNKKSPPQNTTLGGDIFIHGGGTTGDWTWGCVALENEDIKELFDALSIGTPVTIKP